MSPVFQNNVATPIPDFDALCPESESNSQSQIGTLLDALSNSEVKVTRENARQTFEDLFLFLEKAKGNLVSIPYTKTLLDTYLKEPKSDEILAYLWQDTSHIIQKMFAGKTPVRDLEKRVYLATMGAPCAGKTAVLEQYLKAATENCYQNIVLCDPDQPTLGMMNHLYHHRRLSVATVGEQGNNDEAYKKAYEYCRPGSDIIANLLLNIAYAGGYNIAHGTTSTGPVVPDIIKAAKDGDMYAHFLVVAAPDRVRSLNADYRNRILAKHQSTSEEFKSKGAAFLARLPEIFKNEFGLDRIDIYFSPYMLETNYIVGFERKQGVSTDRLVLTDIVGVQKDVDYPHAFLKFCQLHKNAQRMPSDIDGVCDAITSARKVLKHVSQDRSSVSSRSPTYGLEL